MRRTMACMIWIAAAAPVWSQSFEESKVAYDEAIMEARETLSQVFQEQITRKITKGDVAEASQLTEWKNHFDTRQILGGTDDVFMQKYRAYGSAIKKASDDLRAAYLREAERLTKAMESDEASMLLTELTDRRLPGDLISLQQYRSKSYFKHFALDGLAGEIATPHERLNATFELTPGLSDVLHTSIRSLSLPDSYIDHVAFRIKLTAARDDVPWKQHASWIRKPGLADERNGVSFESVSHPGRFLRIRSNGEAWLDKNEETPEFKFQATLYIKKPLFKMW